MSELNQLDTTSPWGKYKLQGISGITSQLLINTGLCRGFIRRTLRKNWKQSQNNILDTNHYGVKYRLYPRHNLCENGILFNSKRYNDEELKILEEFLKPESIFFDIGSNIGHYSLFAAKQGARCFAFEPLPEIYGRLSFNIKINYFENLIKTFHHALGEQNGEACIYVKENNMGSSTIIEESNNQSDGRTAINIKIKTMAEVIQAEQIERIDGLKIDVEGAEDQVLIPFFTSQNQSLWPRCVIIEYWATEHWKTNPINWMLENGYTEYARTNMNMALVLK